MVDGQVVVFGLRFQRGGHVLPQLLVDDRKLPPAIVRQQRDDGFGNLT